MFNQFIGMGNLTRDVEIKYTPSGTAIGNSAIAMTRKWKDNTGTQKEETTFIDITFFGRNAEVANQYLSKGSRILISGRLNQDQWTANDGTKRSKHTIVVSEFKMLSCKDSSGGTGGSSGYGGRSQPQQQQQSQQPAEPEYPEIDIDEEEIPF